VVPGAAPALAKAGVGGYTIIVIDGLSLLVIIVDVIMINNDYGNHIDDDNL
jgi:hypothetical protein